MDHRDSPPFVRGHHRGKCSGKHDKRKYYEEKIIDRRTNQDCTESGRRLGNGRFEKALSQQNAPAVIAALVKQSAAQLLMTGTASRRLSIRQPLSPIVPRTLSNKVCYGC